MLAAQLKDAHFQFVAKPTAEGEQDAGDDNTQTGGTTPGTDTGGNQGGELEG